MEMEVFKNEDKKEKEIKMDAKKVLISLSEKIKEKATNRNKQTAQTSMNMKNTRLESRVRDVCEKMVGLSTIW